MLTPAVAPIDQRFAQLIQQFGLTKNSFAMSLGKTASVVQHLIDGRNKPGYDLLCRVFEIYPNVSRDWLLLGRGPMLVGGGLTPKAVAPAAPELPLQLLDLEPIEVPPARRPAASAAGSRLQPAEISATLALAAAAAQPARAAVLPLEETEVTPAAPAAPAPLATPAAPVAPAPPVPPAPAVPPVPPAPAPVPVPQPAPVAPSTTTPEAPSGFAPEAYVAAALHAQHLQHQLALAELRNQHLLEQQQMLREMLAMARQAV